MGKLLLSILLQSLIQSAVLYLSGVSDISEISTDEYERLEYLSAHPLSINSSSRALGETGLFTAYQIASIQDYRARNGDILSAGELSLVDGFNPSLAKVLACFVNFEAGIRGDFSHQEELFSGASLKIADASLEWKWNSRLYADMQTPVGDFGLSAAYQRENRVGASLEYSAPKILEKLVLGYFNARFGQGLGQWSGVSMESYTSPSSLMKRPSGIAAYRSWSTAYALHGAAATLRFGQFTLSPFASVNLAEGDKHPGNKAVYAFALGRYGGNFSWNHRNGQVGLTAWGVPLGPEFNLSANFQQMCGRFLLFGEAAYSYVADYDALFGLRFPAGICDMGFRLSAGRYRSTATSALSLMKGPHNFNGGMDFLYQIEAKGHSPKGGLQYRLSGNYTYSKNHLVLSSRLNFKLRTLTPISSPSAPYAASWPMFKLGIRQTAGYECEKWSCTATFESVYSKSLSLLGALDASYAGSKMLTAYIQAAIFMVDNWDDRIYLYQRDAPGFLNIPAMYGRGYLLSAFLRLKFWSWAKLYARVSYIDYPWARADDKRQKGSFESRLQLLFTPQFSRRRHSREYRDAPQAEFSVQVLEGQRQGPPQ